MEQPGICAFCVSDRAPVQKRYPFHSHDSYELFLLVSGACAFVTEEFTFRPPEGSVSVFPVGERHGLLVSGSPIRYLSVQFTPDAAPSDGETGRLLSKVFGSARERRLYALEGDSAAIARECLLRLCRIADGPAFREAFFLYLKPVLFEMLRFGRAEAAGARRRRADGRDAALFAEISAYIAAHLAEIPDLSFIGREFHYSEAHVNRLFRRMVADSVWRYIIRKRLDRACDLILEGRRAGEAAAACGFRDYSVFYRMFVRNYGMSPSGLRRTGVKPSLRPLGRAEGGAGG